MTDPDISTGLTQLSYSAMIVWVIQKLKCCPRLKWVNEHTPGLNRILGLALSGLAALGVHWTVVGTFADGAVITIAIPSLAVLGMGLLHWFQSFVAQETLYQMTANRANKNGSAVPVTKP